MKEVVLYQAPSLKIRSNRQLWKSWVRRIGNGFLLTALIGFLLIWGPLLKEELIFRFKKNVSSQLFFGDLIKASSLNSSLVVPDLNFSLIIPKIDARVKIFPNVDASNPKEYLPVLKKGVAHARGTVFPGMKGSIFLFAHSTDAPWNIIRYNAIFYLLGKLEKDDEIILVYGGKRFNYRVLEKKIVDVTETSFFTQKEEELLVLQTCYPPGTTRRALLVFAKR